MPERMVRLHSPHSRNRLGLPLLVGMHVVGGLHGCLPKLTVPSTPGSFWEPDPLARASRPGPQAGAGPAGAGPSPNYTSRRKGAVQTASRTRGAGGCLHNASSGEGWSAPPGPALG